MLEFFILSQFISAILTLLVGVLLIFFIRRKMQENVKEDRPAGFWVRAICLGTDLAIIDILSSFLAFHGSFRAAGNISMVLTFAYFFFFWIFFSATPAQMFARIKILSKESEPLKISQVIKRLGIFIFLFAGWITIFFDKKQKRALHDIVANTHVVYIAKDIKIEKEWTKKVRLIMLGMVVVLLVSLIIQGSGEKLTQYTENDQIKFFDVNKDGLVDGLIMDVNHDGKPDVFKYDLDNDHIVDFTTFDTDKNGVAEAIDINNDGRIDGFDFNKDTKIDVPVSGGQFFIWLWNIFFITWTVGFVALLVFAILKENEILQKGFGR